MIPADRIPNRADRRRRGSVYLVVLGSATLVTVIGLSALATARLQNRQARSTGDLAQARLYALSAIETGLLAVSDSPFGWKTVFWQMPNSAQQIGNGRFTLQAAFIADGDGDYRDDDVMLTGIGHCGQARYILRVRLDTDGAITPGTWRQITN